MPTKKEHESMVNLEKCFNLVQQSSTKGGISAIEIAEKLAMHRTTIHRHLTSLELMGKVESHQGVWKPKIGEQTIKPIEKEIEIELPIPEKESERMAILDVLANEAKERRYPRTSNIYRTAYENYKATRIIRIKGKNIDELDLQKVAVLVQQANDRSAKINLRSFFRNLKPQPKEKSAN